MKDKNVRNSGMGFISVLTLMFVGLGYGYYLQSGFR